MHPGFNYELSINFQRDKIRALYAAEIERINKVKNKQEELLKVIAALNKKSNLNMMDLLPIFYLLEDDFHTAYVLLRYLKAYWDRNITDHMFDVMNARLYEGIEQNENLVSNFLAGDSVFRDVSSKFSVKNKEFNELIIRNMIPDDYNGKPQARHVSFESTPEYQSSYDMVFTSIGLIEIYFRQEKYLEFSESLFRFQHALSSGEPPRHLLEIPKHRFFAPIMHCYDNWYQARMEKDEKRRQTLAWMALYWYLEEGLRNPPPEYELFEFETCCQIIGELELMGKKHNDFLRHFKREAACASMSVYKKMSKAPPAMIAFKDTGLPDAREFKAKYDEWTGKAPKKAKGTKAK